MGTIRGGGEGGKAVRVLRNGGRRFFRGGDGKSGPGRRGRLRGREGRESRGKVGGGGGGREDHTGGSSCEGE